MALFNSSALSVPPSTSIDQLTSPVLLIWCSLFSKVCSCTQSGTLPVLENLVYSITHWSVQCTQEPRLLSQCQWLQWASLGRYEKHWWYLCWQTLICLCLATVGRMELYASWDGSGLHTRTDHFIIAWMRIKAGCFFSGKKSSCTDQRDI